MYSNWTKVFETFQNYQAHIVKEVLEDNDIKSVVLDKQDSSYRFGHSEVLVQKDDVMRALFIIKEKITFG